MCLQSRISVSYSGQGLIKYHIYTPELLLVLLPVCNILLWLSKTLAAGPVVFPKAVCPSAALEPNDACCLCRALAAHARGLSEANEELVDQRIDLMVQLAHLKAFLSNADKHERKLRVGSCLCMSETSKRHGHVLFICCHAHDLMLPCTLPAPSVCVDKKSTSMVGRIWHRQRPCLCKQ